MLRDILALGAKAVTNNNGKRLSVILFDLGFTLINFEGDFHQAMKESYVALANSLVKSGYPIEVPLRIFLRKKQPQSGYPIEVASFAKKFEGVISEYYRCRAIDLIERPVEESLQKVLADIGLNHLPQSDLQEAVKSMYTYTESWWKIEPDAHATLTKLREMGYRLGLISNAANTPDLNRLIDNHNLRGYFEVIVISADEGIRKPDPRIFSRTLARFGVKPEHAAMVGDTLPADILGAHNAGICSIWITRRANREENNTVQGIIHPDHTIPDLASLVDLVKLIDSQTS